MEQIASWMEEALRASATVLTKQLDQELERRGRDATEEPALPQLDRMDRSLACRRSRNAPLKRRRSRFRHTPCRPASPRSSRP